MFIILTLGLILVFKWMMKALDLVLWCLARFFASNATNQSEEDQRESFTKRVLQILRPEIFLVDSLLEETRTQHERMRAGSALDPMLNPEIASLIVRVKRVAPERISEIVQQCAICLDELVGSTVTSLPCDPQRRHTFHEDCLRSWL